MIFLKNKNPPFQNYNLNQEVSQEEKTSWINISKQNYNNQINNNNLNNNNKKPYQRPQSGNQKIEKKKEILSKIVMEINYIIQTILQNKDLKMEEQLIKLIINNIIIIIIIIKEI